MNELLSIAIPTRNRAKFLKELLASISSQIKENASLASDIKVYVFDNVSEDDTYEVVKNANIDILYQKNPNFLSAYQNIYQAYTSTQGEYVWVIGDDELLPHNSLKLLLELIKTYSPNLVINFDEKYNALIKLPVFFQDYSAFALFAEKFNPHLLLAHSLISANILKKKCFDAGLASKNIQKSYAYFYGIISGVKSFPGGIVCPGNPTIIVRDHRAPPVDGIWPNDLEDQQADYLRWVKEQFNLSNFDPDSVVTDYRKKIRPHKPPQKNFYQRAAEYLLKHLMKRNA
jgi:glycosyltransferase involved in cell wall biosynthesis